MLVLPHKKHGEDSRIYTRVGFDAAICIRSGNAGAHQDYARIAQGRVRWLIDSISCVKNGPSRVSGRILDALRRVPAFSGLYDSDCGSGGVSWKSSDLYAISNDSMSGQLFETIAEEIRNGTPLRKLHSERSSSLGYDEVAITEGLCALAGRIPHGTRVATRKSLTRRCETRRRNARIRTKIRV